MRRPLRPPNRSARSRKLRPHAAPKTATLASHPNATDREVVEAIGRKGRTGRRCKTEGLKLLAERGHMFAATATLPVELAEYIADAATGRADAEDLAEFGHDLMDHIADMAAIS